MTLLVNDTKMYGQETIVLSPFTSRSYKLVFQSFHLLKMQTSSVTFCALY